MTLPWFQQYWPFVLFPAAMTLGAAIVAGTIVLASPDLRAERKACDEIFARFMVERDPVEVARDGVLLSRIGCGIGRRYTKFVQQQETGVKP